MKKCFFTIYIIIIMGVIFYFSNQPGVKSSTISDKVATTVGVEQTDVKVSVSATPVFAGLSIRKYAHIALYFLLGIGAYGVTDDNKRIYKRIIIASLVCFIYSLSDEFHQLFVIGREGKLSDCGVDAIGYVIAIALYLAMAEILKKIKKFWYQDANK